MADDVREIFRFTPNYRDVPTFKRGFELIPEHQIIDCIEYLTNPNIIEEKRSDDEKSTRLAIKWLGKAEFSDFDHPIFSFIMTKGVETGIVYQIPLKVLVQGDLSINPDSTEHRLFSYAGKYSDLYGGECHLFDTEIDDLWEIIRKRREQ